MRKIVLLAVSLLMVAMAAVGKEYKVEDVPNVQLADSRQRVSDPENLLSPAARDSINLMLARLKTTTGIEVGVVMLPSIGEADVMDFGNRLYRAWGIGNKKTNAGMLILYVEDIHRVRFENGYGLEGVMTDAMSKRIQVNYMVPRFKEGDRDGGMVAGVKAVTKVLDGSMKPEESEEEEEFPWYAAVIMVSVMVGTFLFLIWLIDYVTRRCPHCKKTALKKMSSNVIKRGNRTYRRDTFICRNCGKVVTKDHDITPNNNNNLTNGMIIGSMLGGGRRGGGGFSGGGFSGGGWGGGSSGGGGSTSGW